MSVIANNILAGAAGQGGAAAGDVATKSLRFNSGDSSHLSRTPSSAGNRRKWTVSLWLKRSKLGTNNQHVLETASSPEFSGLWFASDDSLEFRGFNGSSYTYRLHTSQKFRDPSAWYHIVLNFDSTASTASDRLAMYVNGVEVTSFDNTVYPSQNHDSNWNNTSAHYIATLNYPGVGLTNFYGGYIADLHSIDGSILGPTSFGAFDDNGVWQAAAYSGTYGTNGFHLGFGSSDIGEDSSGNNNDFTANNLVADGSKGSWYFNGSAGITGTMTALGNQNWTVEMFIEKTSSAGQEALLSFSSDNPTFETDQPSKVRWMSSGVYGSTLAQNTRYHIAWVRNSNKGYIYVDGTLISPSSGIDYSDNDTNTSFSIGERTGGTTGFTGYIDNVRVVVGTAVYTSNFTVPSTPLTAVSNTKLLTLTSASLSDTSGQNVSLTNGGAVEEFASSQDVLFDVPTNGTQSDTGAGGEVSGNYATLNALQTGSSLTLSNGNLALDGHSNWRSSYSTIFLPSGKWYAEFTIRQRNSSNSYGILVGLAGLGTNFIEFEISGGDSYAVQNGPGNMKINNNGGSTDLGSQSAYAVGDVLQLAYDADNGKLWFGKNGTYINSGNPSAGSNEIKSGISGTYCFAVALLTTSDKIDCNFGQRSWAYSAPTNFKAVCTTNLPPPTIADGSDYFDTKLYTGTNASKTITGLSFSPSFIWTKSRSRTDSHGLHDSVRGRASSLYSDATYVENTSSASADLVSFDSNGYTLGTVEQTAMNRSGETYVAWAWNAGSSNTSISAGSLNSSVYNQSQNWSSNFSSSNGFATSAANAFDGSTSTEAYASSNGGVLTMTFSPSLSGEIEMDIPNGGTFKNSSTDAAIGSFSGRTWTYTASNLPGIKIEQTGGRPNPTRVKLDGKILVDSTATPPNFPSIASTVRANPTAGFSIVTYTGNGTGGASIGHGLNAAVEFLIIKDRSAAASWHCQHSAIGNTSAIFLNSTSAAVSNGAYWNNTSPTNSVFTVGTADGMNGSGNTYVAYCFAPVAGYSAMGTYEGTGSNVFVHLGFRPRFILHKDIDTAHSWHIFDTARDIDNPVVARLFPNNTNAENTSNNNLDMLSNGFVAKDSNTTTESGKTYIYYAVAENPFQANGGLAR